MAGRSTALGKVNRFKRPANRHAGDKRLSHLVIYPLTTICLLNGRLQSRDWLKRIPSTA